MEDTEQERRKNTLLTLCIEYHLAVTQEKPEEVIENIIDEIEVVTTRYTFFRDMERMTCKKQTTSHATR